MLAAVPGEDDSPTRTAVSERAWVASSLATQRVDVGPRPWFAEFACMDHLALRCLHLPYGLLRYAVSPNGRLPLLLLPGMNEPWHSFAPAVAGLAAYFEVYLVELRGHGPGHETTPHSGFSVTDYARDAAALLRTIGRPAIVAGNSLGGLVAAVLARDLSALVAGVVFEDAPFFLTEGTAWEHHWLQEARFRPLRAALAARDRDGLDFESFLALYDSMPLPSPPGTLTQTWSAALPADAVRLRAMKDYQIDRAVLDAACTSRFADFAHAETLAAIPSPALYIAADDAVSAIVPAEIGVRVASACRNCTLVPSPGAGHEIHRDDPEHFAATLVRRFVA